ncbi:unnamed protein product [Candidula unifasciata]|uniref:Anaphase-promoting complex subunit 4-like WD40 domain-containing protein n=1 Tax=Candidula unifasciata TaxID=100452 RepID=A0A8S3YRQ9_9EUPU|nr:unnamed protein product [Candidula unifasciata]
MMGEDIKRFKLREEKHTVAEIELMAWSPTMDLLALANVNGEVLVNRLSWQRVWSLSPPSEGEKICGLAWRPDGKVIAVGYSSGVVRICDVEKGDLVYVGSVRGSVTSLEWVEQSEHMNQGPEHYAEDNSSDYLPVSQQLTSLYSESSVTKDQSLNLLIVGTDLCEVNIFSLWSIPHLCHRFVL